MTHQVFHDAHDGSIIQRRLVEEHKHVGEGEQREQAIPQY